MVGESGVPLRTMQVRLSEGGKGHQGDGYQGDGRKVRQPRRKERGHQPTSERAEEQGQTTQQLHLAQTLLKRLAVPEVLKQGVVEDGFVGARHQGDLDSEEESADQVGWHIVAESPKQGVE